MQKRTDNLTFGIDNDGYVTCTGDAVTDEEEYMKNIITSNEVRVNLRVQNTDVLNAQRNGVDVFVNEGGGSFMGNHLFDDGKKAYCMQVINMKDSRKVDPNSGTLIWHEISESYEGGLISISRQKDCSYNSEEAKIVYQMAHAKASRWFSGDVKKMTVWGVTTYYLNK